MPVTLVGTLVDDFFFMSGRASLMSPRVGPGSPSLGPFSPKAGLNEKSL